MGIPVRMQRVAQIWRCGLQDGLRDWRLRLEHWIRHDKGLFERSNQEQDNEVRCTISLR